VLPEASILAFNSSMRGTRSARRYSGAVNRAGFTPDNHLSKSKSFGSVASTDFLLAMVIPPRLPRQVGTSRPPRLGKTTAGRCLCESGRGRDFVADLEEALRQQLDAHLQVALV